MNNRDREGGRGQQGRAKATGTSANTAELQGAAGAQRCMLLGLPKAAG